jgi:hypothetical protein
MATRSCFLFDASPHVNARGVNRRLSAVFNAAYVIVTAGAKRFKKSVK